MATIDDVAKAAGVSKRTVSNVFSKKLTISKEVTERVLAVAKELITAPIIGRVVLPNRSTKIIGINIQGESLKFSQYEAGHYAWQPWYRRLGLYGRRQRQIYADGLRYAA